jgi:hypothetical protein
MADPLRVWLVEHNNPFAAAPSAAEAAQVRSGMVTLLKQWFTKVVKHSAANASRPAAFKSDVEVQWTDLKNVTVGDHDIVVYFSPLSLPGSKGGPKSVRAGPFKDAVDQLPNQSRADQDMVQDLRTEIAKQPTSGGLTLRYAFVSRNSELCLPIISEVFVLYDAQLSMQQLRIKNNVVTFATAAFHEAAHNKYEVTDPSQKDRVHQDGGGAMFAEQYTGTVEAPSEDNIKFFAGLIWNWGPQYIRGQPLSLVQKP